MTLYVLSTDNSGAYKIGHTSQWDRRLRSYQDHAFNVVVHIVEHRAGLKEERQLHRFFAGKRITRSDARSEWFRLSRGDLELIRDLLSDPKALPEALSGLGSNQYLGALGLLDDQEAGNYDHVVDGWDG